MSTDVWWFYGLTMNQPTYEEKTRSGALMRRIMGFRRAWLCERGSRGHSPDSRADEDLDIACNLLWRARGTNYFRVNLIPLRFLLRVRDKRSGIGVLAKFGTFTLEEDILYIHFYSRVLFRGLRGSSLCALHFACIKLTVFFVRIEVDNEGETRSKKSQNNWKLGFLFEAINIQYDWKKQQCTTL